MSEDDQPDMQQSDHPEHNMPPTERSSPVKDQTRYGDSPFDLRGPYSSERKYRSVTAPNQSDYSRERDWGK